MVLFPRTLAGLLISGEAPIQLVCEYLPICGMTIIFVDCLFVIRSGVQGMGHPVPPMWSGVLEMVLRIAVISFFIDKVGFKAAAFAEISAWSGALIMNLIAFCKILMPKLEEGKKSIPFLAMLKQ
jgi:Na+-driven multidrug efflux pump